VLRALDDHHVRRDLPGLKFQVELFFDGGENDAGEIRGLGHRCCCGDWAGVDGFELQVEVVAAGHVRTHEVKLHFAGVKGRNPAIAMRSTLKSAASAT
jgi:hypothetical protein